jgi:nucleoside-diphosphate-sugar epimerase
MHVLLTGATGFIGSRVAVRLSARGHRITAAIRTEATVDRLRALNIGLGSLVASLEQPDELATFARSVDAVVHLAFDHALQRTAGLSVAEALGAAVMKERRVVGALVDALAGTGRPLILTTACGILGDTGKNPVDESHLSPSNFPPAARRVVEDDSMAAAQRGVRTAVIRPPLLTHSSQPVGPVHRLKEAARQAGLAGYIGVGDNRLSCVNVEDLADLYLLALEEAAPGSVFNGAGADISTRELAEIMGRALGSGVRVEAISRERAMEIWGPFAGALMAINNRCSNLRARGELGWRPYEKSHSLEEDLC